MLPFLGADTTPTSRFKKFSQYTNFYFNRYSSFNKQYPFILLCWIFIILFCDFLEIVFLFEQRFFCVTLHYLYFYFFYILDIFKENDLIDNESNNNNGSSSSSNKHKTPKHGVSSRAETLLVAQSAPVIAFIIKFQHPNLRSN